MKAFIDKLPGFLAAFGGLLVSLASISAGVGVRTLLFRVALATVIAMAAGVGVRWFLTEQAGLSEAGPKEAEASGKNLDITVSEDKFEDLKDLLTGEAPESAAAGVDAEQMAQAVRLSITQERQVGGLHEQR